MYTCKNKEDKYYTGRENTPLGRGYYASGEKKGQIRVGRDGKKYKAGNGRWVLIEKRRFNPRMELEDDELYRRMKSYYDDGLIVMDGLYPASFKEELIIPLVGYFNQFPDQYDEEDVKWLLKKNSIDDVDGAISYALRKEETFHNTIELFKLLDRYGFEIESDDDWYRPNVLDKNISIASGIHYRRMGPVFAA